MHQENFDDCLNMDYNGCDGYDGQNTFTPETAKKLLSQIAGNASNITNDVRLSAIEISNTPFKNIESAKKLYQKTINLTKGLKMWINIVNNLCEMCQRYLLIIKIWNLNSNDESVMIQFITNMILSMNYSLYSSRYYSAIAGASISSEIDENMNIIPCELISGFNIVKTIVKTDSNQFLEYCTSIEYNNKLYIGYLHDVDFDNFVPGIINKLTKRYLHEVKEQQNFAVRFNSVPYGIFEERRNIIMQIIFFILDGKMSFICKIHDADTCEQLLTIHISPDDLENMSIEDAIPNNIHFELSDFDYEYSLMDMIDYSEDDGNIKENVCECVGEHM
jgi:hypothetical protein